MVNVSSLGELRQKWHREFKASLDFIERTCLEQQQQKQDEWTINACGKLDAPKDILLREKYHVKKSHIISLN